MRVLIAAPLYPPDPGGPATYARSLEQALPEVGVEVIVAKFGHVRRYPSGIRHILYFFMLLRSGKNADVILALDPVSVGLPAALAAGILRKPLVVKVVGDYAWEQGRQRFGVTDTLDQFVTARSLPFEVRFLQDVESWVAQRAVHIIVPSEYLKRIVSTWKGIDADAITVIYNAMRDETTGAAPASVLALPRPRIVSIGRLVPWKHMEGVIDAVTDIDGASLIIVGDGPSRERIEQRAAQLAPGKVLFTGALAHDATLATLREADIFVLNSSYEGLSHLLIEALSLGVPSIATSVGGNPELVTHEENGLLIASRDTDALRAALMRLLGDAPLRARLSEGARLSSARFSMEAMIIATKSLLTSIA
ncbi:MAG: glycosyltransferase family 4 protein [Patescibacteria group bacterium]